MLHSPPLLSQHVYGETLIVGDDIKVTILESNGGQMLLGIEAPRTTPVHREEVYNRIQAEADLPDQSSISR